MIVCEHFIYGLFSTSGYKLLHTDQVKKILTKESLEILKNLRLKKGQSTDIVTMHFPSEDVITFSYLQKTNDVYGRDGVSNHTIIMRTSDLFHECPQVLDFAFNLIKDKLVVDLKSPLQNLEPIKIET